METEKIEYFRRLLLKKKKRLEGRLGKLEDKFKRSQQDASGDLSNLPTHMADLGTDAGVRERSSYLINSIVSELEKVNKAIEKTYSKTYGLCEKCGDEINFERLKAVPYAELCIKCGENAM